jgi:myo-inositol-1(or 4)-monophosphatase
MNLTDAEVALAAARAGADVVRRHFRRPVTRHLKEGTDFATDADLESEAAVREVLARHRPDDAQLGEEGGASGSPEARRRWLVDPLCGTRNFAAGLPMFATNVALSVDGSIVAGAVADPAAGEASWYDEQGARLRRDGQDHDLTPSAETLLVEANLDGSHDRLLRALAVFGHPRFFGTLEPRVVSSSLGLAWLAGGRLAAYLTEGDLRDNVHFAAGVGLAVAAGCVVTDLDGGPVDTGAGEGARRGLLAAADQATHTRLLEICGDAFPR